MKKLDMATLATLCILTCGAALIGFCNSCSYVNEQIGVPDDNPLEQATEIVLDALIEDQTGIDPNIDLTPESDHATD